MEEQDQIVTPEISQNLVRGCAELGCWPLFRPLAWRLSSRAISPELSPGFAWLDVRWVVFWRNRRLRRLALQAYSLWLPLFLLFCVSQVAMMASVFSGSLGETRWAFPDFGETRWAFLEFAITIAMFLAIIALSLSAAAAASSSVTSFAAILVFCASGSQHTAAMWTLASIILAVPAFLAARFEHQHELYSIARRLGRIAAAPIIATAMWVVSGILVVLVLAIIVALVATVRVALVGGGMMASVSEGLGLAELAAPIMLYNLLPESGAGFAGALGLGLGVLFSVVHVFVGRVTRKW